MSSLKADIVTFLKRDPNIPRLNFAFKTYKVYPTAYQKDVADAIDSGEIKVGTGVPSGAAASYYAEYDRLELSPSFSISNSHDQAFLVHECTHAHLDIQNLGKLSGHENEAVAYLAEAMYLEASGNPPISTIAIRVVSHRIAKDVLSGTYTVPAKDAAELVTEVAADPHYSSTILFESNGFNRSLFRSILRRL